LSSFIFHTPAPTPLYPLSLHDALPISRSSGGGGSPPGGGDRSGSAARNSGSYPRRIRCSAACCRSPSPSRSSPLPPRSPTDHRRSEEHTSELQSLRHLVCRLLLEKKKQ